VRYEEVAEAQIVVREAAAADPPVERDRRHRQPVFVAEVVRHGTFRGEPLGLHPLGVEAAALPPLVREERAQDLARLDEPLSEAGGSV
jgi:hypothetical protein